MHPVEYAAPVPYRMALTTPSSRMAMFVYGPSYSDRREGIIATEEAGGIWSGDAAWIDVLPPDEPDLVAQTADYFVESVAIGRRFTRITFVRKEVAAR
jgi:hypothetical protein